MQPRWHAGLWLVAVAGCAGLVALTAVRLDRSLPPAAERAPVYLPKAEYLRPMTLGWNNAVADLIWFRTISYFGEHYRGDRTYDWLAAMCELVTDLDPCAIHVYRFAGVILPWEADQAEAGVRLLQKGLRQFPDSWLLHYYLGFNEFFFRDDSRSAVRHLRAAAALPDAHPIAATLASLLAAQVEGPEAAMAFLTEMERNTESGQMREVIAEQRNGLQLAADLAQLDAAAATYAERYGQPPADPQALVDVGLLLAVPGDPFGGQYEFDPRTGLARSSSGRQPSKLHTSKIRERILRGESAKDL